VFHEHSTALESSPAHHHVLQHELETRVAPETRITKSHEMLSEFIQIQRLCALLINEIITCTCGEQVRKLESDGYQPEASSSFPSAGDF
jgi:hypothetical protein